MTTRIYKSYEDFENRENLEENGISEYFALKYPNFEKLNLTNIGCWNCVDCIYCTNCINCDDCRVCTNCKDCAKCDNCKDCTNCTNCLRCTNSNGLKDIKLCFGVLKNKRAN